MRILFLTPAANLGGAERCTLDLVSSISAFAPRAEIGLIAGADGPMLQDAEALGVRVIRLPFGTRLAQVGDSALRSQGARAFEGFARRLARAANDAADYARRLRTAIRDFSPSVLHSNGNKMHLLAAAARGHAPLIWHIHDFIGERPVISRAMRMCAWRANGAIAISNAVARDIERVIPRMPTTTIHDAIDTDVFAPLGPVANLDRLAGRGAGSAGTLRVGLVATYARWKGHDVFLRAASHLMSCSGLPDIRFYVVGGPIYETAASQYDQDELSALVRQLGLTRSVCFVPFQRQIQDVYRALDIVVHASSRPEPFGRTIAEGMASGKAVVVTRDGGASELFVDGVDAIGVPSRDPAALADALRALIADGHRRAALGHAARATAVRCYSRARLAGEVFGAYRRAGCIAV
jgi:glycosyltransferase involved in cell wall biosynthesis